MFVWAAVVVEERFPFLSFLNREVAASYPSLTFTLHIRLQKRVSFSSPRRICFILYIGNVLLTLV